MLIVLNCFFNTSGYTLYLHDAHAGPPRDEPGICGLCRLDESPIEDLLLLPVHREVLAASDHRDGQGRSGE